MFRRIITKHSKIIHLKSKPQPWGLTHSGQVTHIGVGNLIIIGSDNGLSRGQCQAIIWTNAWILSIGPWRKNFSEILIQNRTFSLKKMRLKMSSGKWRPFCLGLNVLKWVSSVSSNDAMWCRRSWLSLIQLMACFLVNTNPFSMGLLPDTQNCRLCMRRECRERFPHHRLERKMLVSDPGMYHGTCVTHVPWCMSGSLTRGYGGNVSGIHGACAIRNFPYLARGPYQ